jgi:UDP-glucuronate 4-epimerase
MMTTRPESDRAVAHYLVTGAAGFIASHVVELLLADGHRVTSIDDMNDFSDPRLKAWRVARLERSDGFRLRIGDVADRGTVESVFDDAAREGAGFDAVLNLAARAGVRPSVLDPWLYYRVNLNGTLNLLEAAVAHGVGKFVLSSTSSLYGACNSTPFREDADTDGPLSPYAASKKAAETLCYTYHYLHGVDVTVLRYFTVYGPAGRPDMSPFRFVQWIREGKPVTVFGDGSQERDFTFIDDIARGTVAAIAPLGYEVINLGSDEPVPLMALVRRIEKLTGRSAELRFEPAHAADMKATWADIGRAGRLLDWRPQTTFDDGVRRLVEWYEENREWARQIRTA